MLPLIPDGIAPGWYYLAVGTAVLIIGIAKAGFGGGVGVLAVPLMASVMGAQHMLGLMLPVLIAADILSNVHYLREYEWPLLRWLLVGSVAGVAVGTGILLLLKGSNDVAFPTMLSFVVGTVCLVIVVLQAYRLTGRALPTLPSHPASSLGVGFVSGGVSTVSHSAGPIVTIYLLQEKVKKRKLMGTVLLYYLLINTIKVPPFIYLGLITGQTLRDSIWFIPLLPLGTLAGAWMNKRLPERPFAAIMYVFAGIAAGYMVYKALA